MGLMIEMLIGGVIAFVICAALGLYVSYLDRKFEDEAFNEKR